MRQTAILLLALKLSNGMEKLFNPDYLLSLCKKYGLTPSKKYGQNYLLDETVIDSMVKAGEVSKNDTVVEVGPGFGVLTLSLVEHAGKVVTFEIEKKLENYWRDTIIKRQINNLQVVWGNVLRSFETVAIETPYKVLANLPYQITSAVIRAFLEARVRPTVMVCMVQKEVAERICAQPGDLSVLALSVQLYAKAELIQVVPRTAFWPAPAVDSAILKLTLLPESPEEIFVKHLFTVVKWGFAQKRKVLFNNLLPNLGKNHKTELETCFKELGLELTARAQELSLDQWQKMTRYCLDKSFLKLPKRA